MKEELTGYPKALMFYRHNKTIIGMGFRMAEAIFIISRTMSHTH